MREKWKPRPGHGPARWSSLWGGFASVHLAKRDRSFQINQRYRICFCNGNLFQFSSNAKNHFWNMMKHVLLVRQLQNVGVVVLDHAILAEIVKLFVLTISKRSNVDPHKNIKMMMIMGLIQNTWKTYQPNARDLKMQKHDFSVVRTYILNLWISVYWIFGTRSAGMPNLVWKRQESTTDWKWGAV